MSYSLTASPHGSRGTSSPADLGRVMYACHLLVPFTGFFSPAERLAAAFAAQAK